MSTLNILLLTLLCALALACATGVAVGKYQAKKAAGQVRGLLSPRERAVYAASVVLGATLLLVGVFYQGPPRQPDEWEMMGGAFFEGEQFEGEHGGAMVALPPGRQAHGGSVVIVG